ncbi:hypothetical protein [Nitrospirillum amazonense]|uniref:hypothetical protein n=1 Tax=Nitrospirillum amazonense TaxID=28077 RepID=UPI0024129AA0|nr:hypothetical protein [Nitrospirillum amazonense]MDG3444614.1 hypothetical protein [Nitrospirillum amazonense]
MSQSPQNLIITGTGRDEVVLGTRLSGLTVAKTTSTSQKLQIIAPASLGFAPALWAEAMRHGLQVKGDGRIVIEEAIKDPAAVIAVLDSACAEGHRGGINPGSYAGVYTVQHSTDAWEYIVTTTPAGRTALKRIGTWTGLEGSFTVPFERGDELAACLERAETSLMKTTSTTVVLPKVPGLSVSVVGAEIHVAWPGSDEAAEILRGVRSMRWDKAARRYVVLARYSKSLGQALEKIAVIRQRLDEQGQDRRVAEAARRQVELEARAQKIATDRAEVAERMKTRVQVRCDKAPAIGGLVPWWGGTFRAVESYGASWVEKETGHTVMYAYTREASPEEVARHLAALDAAPKTGTVTVPAEQARPVGTTWRLRDGMAVVTTGLSLPWYIDASRDDGVTSLYSSALWDRHVVAVDWREATPAEAAALGASETVEASRNAVLIAAEEIAVRIETQGSSPVKVERPFAGEVLAQRVGGLLHGYGEWMVLGDDGLVWMITYKGGDGDTWGSYNLGENTRGICATVSSQEVELLREAAALRGHNPYRKVWP